MEVTAYDNCPICCEKYFGFWKTAAGRNSRLMDGAAADWRLLPPGTTVRIPVPESLRQAYRSETNSLYRVIDDSGGAMRYDADRTDVFGRPKQVVYHIDLRVENHALARVWGVQRLPVDILELVENPELRLAQQRAARQAASKGAPPLIGLIQTAPKAQATTPAR